MRELKSVEIYGEETRVFKTGKNRYTFIYDQVQYDDVVVKDKKDLEKAIRRELYHANVDYKNAKPLRSTPEQLNAAVESSNTFIGNILSPADNKVLNKVIRDFKNGKDSKSKYYRNGKYSTSRIAIHNKIIKKFIDEDKHKGAPDVYVFGGPSGSGKSTNLGKYVHEDAVMINNDDIKEQLSKYDPSPLVDYPLLHAGYLHEESSDIEEKILKKALINKNDIILDRTLASYVKNREILKSIKARGYRVTVLGTNLKPHIAISRSSLRFLEVGRYVPVSHIAEKGNKMNSSVLKMAKQPFVDDAKIVDTSGKKAKIIYSK